MTDLGEGTPVVMEMTGQRLWYAPWRRRLTRFTFTNVVMQKYPDGTMEFQATPFTESTKETTSVAAWPWSN